MITANEISYSYDSKKEIITDFSYCFEDKNIYAISGSNGVGKTTLLKIILGLLKPSKGEIIKDESYRTGFVPDYNGLYENMTVIDNIKFRMGLYGMKFSENKKAVFQLLKK